MTISTEIFSDIHAAEQAYQEAIKMGYKPDEINLIMSEATRQQFNIQTNASTLEETSTVKNVIKGAAIGGGIGATFGILTAVGASILAPELGVFVAGPILGGLASASAGAIAGGLVQLLGPSGITSEEAKRYEYEIKNGGILIAVHTNGDDMQKLHDRWHAIKRQNVAVNF